MTDHSTNLACDKFGRKKIFFLQEATTYRGDLMFKGGSSSRIFAYMNLWSPLWEELQKWVLWGLGTHLSKIRKSEGRRAIFCPTQIEKKN